MKQLNAIMVVAVQEVYHSLLQRNVQEIVPLHMMICEIWDNMMIHANEIYLWPFVIVFPFISLRLEDVVAHRDSGYFVIE